MNESILPTAKRNNAIPIWDSQNERSEGVMDVDESTVSINVQEKPPKVKEPIFVQGDRTMIQRRIWLLRVVVT